MQRLKTPSVMFGALVTAKQVYVSRKIVLNNFYLWYQRKYQEFLFKLEVDYIEHHLIPLHKFYVVEDVAITWVIRFGG